MPWPYTGFQQTADVVSGCQSVINDNSECDQAGDSFNILPRWSDLGVVTDRSIDGQFSQHGAICYKIIYVKQVA